MRLTCVSSHALRRLRTPLALSGNDSRRCLHDKSKQYDIGVIGAGITGLTAAYRLSKDPNCRKVTLYEKSSRVGGWIESERINVDGGDIVFEYGPRTLRVAAPASFALLDLLSDLGLDKEILLTPKSSPAAQNRYIYYPDHLVRLPTFRKGVSVLSQIPGVLSTLIREPLFKGLIWSLITEPWKSRGKRLDYDESVTDYISRRLSPEVANNLVSSLFHGVYAGDIDRLSANSFFWTIRRDRDWKELSMIREIIQNAQEGKRVFYMDDLFVMEMIKNTKSVSHRRYIERLAKDTSTLTFKNGVGQLAESLATALKQSGKVEVLTDAHISMIHKDDETSDLTVEFRHSNRRHESRLHNRLIATIPPDKLAVAFREGQKRKGTDVTLPRRTILALTALRSGGAETTMVVNLYYSNPNLLPVRGFGYLIPRSIPFEQNPERALGVIFASESSLGQDSAPGTKLTVMMGGHYWDSWHTSDYPDHDTAVAMAQSLLKRHLGITDAPAVARARLQREAIPQPRVEHAASMSSLSKAIKHEFDNRVTLAGAWYSVRSTGVVDGIRQAYVAAACYAGDTEPQIRRKAHKWLFPGGVVGYPATMVKDLPAAIKRDFW